MKTHTQIYKEWLAPVIKVGKVVPLTEKYAYPFAIALTWLLRLPKDPYMLFVKRILHLWKYNGPTFVVQYLKECVRITQHYISGNPVYKSQDCIVGLSAGLPKIIPGPLRLLIKGKDQNNIRGVLSVLQMYRVIKIPVKLKLETITDPFKGRYPTIPSFELRESLARLGVPLNHDGSNNRTLIVDKLITSTSAGPNSPKAMFGLNSDLRAWVNSGKLENLYNYLQVTHSFSFLEKVKSQVEQLTKYINSDLSRSYENFVQPQSWHLGRLSIKEEPAGKARVFAITDSLTQTALRPLHDYLFSLVKKIPADGTFNQSRPLEFLIEKTRGRDVKFYSFDLSAATDRLPIILQRDILSLMFGMRLSRAWQSLLGDREWHLQGTDYKYSTGQPMGALSSWGMLALTHHVIVQVAAARVGFDKTFTDYAILGDDIVVANQSVAKAYHALMTDWLGVDINPFKTLVSTHMFEFAKRLISFEGEYTPVGAKNLMLALTTPRGIISLVYDIANKGVTFTDREYQQMVSKLPFRYGKKVKDLLLWSIQGPFGFVPTESGLSSIYSTGSSLTSVQVSSLIYAIQKALYLMKLRTWNESLKTLVNLIVKLRVAHPSGFPSLPKGPMDRLIEEQTYSLYKRHLRSRPVFRLLFNGPLIISNYTRPTWGIEVGSYIKSLIFDSTQERCSLEVGDPFSEKADLPLKLVSRSGNFFTLVRDIDREAARERMAVQRELYADDDDD